MPDAGAPTLSTEQVAQVLRLLRSADSVELKLSVPDADRRSAVAALGIDPLDAQIRQVVFLDTPALTLNQHGVVVRVRRIQRKPGDSVVKLRPLVPEQLPPALRRSRDMAVEVDAMPGGFVCSGSMKAQRDDALLKDAVAGRQSLRRLFTKRQRAFFSAHAPDGVELDDLAVLGPINVLKVKFTPEEHGRRLVAELWTYPDGSRVLELSTKCEPTEAFDVAAETRALLAGHGVDLMAEQQTKTKKALEFFANELRGGN
ncbi:MAG: adenylate cyclase [Acidimicrobiales bacterium]